MGCGQLTEWCAIDGLQTPISVWFPGLFNPTAFLTGIKQVTARLNSLALDKMATETHVTAFNGPEECGERLPEGMYIHGLFCEGAQWRVREREVRLRGGLDSAVRWYTQRVQAEGAAATDAHHLRQGRAGPAVVGPAVCRLHPTGAGPLQLPRVSDDVPRPDLGLRRDAQDGQARVALGAARRRARGAARLGGFPRVRLSCEQYVRKAPRRH